MSPVEQRTITATADGKGMTLGELRGYVAALDEVGCPDDAHPYVRVTITGRINVLRTTFDPASTE